MTLMKSWVTSANTPDTPFPLNNLPYGVFSVGDEDARCGVAIGDMILDMAALETAELIHLDDDAAFDLPFWNDVMELGPDIWAKLRARLHEMLAEGSADQAAIEPYLVPLADARLHMPLMVSEYTDFYAGRQHAQNMGRSAGQLAAHSSRLQRSRIFSCCFWHRHPSPQWPIQGS